MKDAYDQIIFTYLYLNSASLDDAREGVSVRIIFIISELLCILVKVMGVVSFYLPHGLDFKYFLLLEGCHTMLCCLSVIF